MIWNSSEVPVLAPIRTYSETSVSEWATSLSGARVPRVMHGICHGVYYALGMRVIDLTWIDPYIIGRGSPREAPEYTREYTRAQGCNRSEEGGGKGSGTQKPVYQKWPRSFPFVNLICSQNEIWVQGGGGYPPCDIPSGCCFFTGPRTVTRSSLRVLPPLLPWVSPVLIHPCPSGSGGVRGNLRGQTRESRPK